MANLKGLRDGGPVRRPGDPVPGTRGPVGGATGGGLSRAAVARPAPSPRPAPKQGIAGLPADPLRNPKAILRAREAAAGMADGGRVKGAGGRRGDKIGPVMLSDDEYVLPADTADAVGRDNLDALRLQTHKFSDPHERKSLRGAVGLVDGGSPDVWRDRNNPRFQPNQPNVERTRASPQFQHAGPGARGPGASAFGPNSIPPDGSRPIHMGGGSSFGGQRAANPNIGKHGYGPGAFTPQHLEKAKPTAAYRAGRAVGKFTRGTGKLHAYTSAGLAVADSMDEDSTARYARRFAVDEPTGDGSFGDIAKFVGLRAGGFATDLADRLTLGQASRLYRDRQEDEAAAAAQPQALPAPDEAAAPQDMADDTPAATPLPGRDVGYGIRRIDEPGKSSLLTNREDPYAPMPIEPRTEEQAAANLQRNLAGYERAIQDTRELSMMRSGLQDRGDTDFYRPENVAAREQRSRTASLDRERANLRSAYEDLAKQDLTPQNAMQTAVALRGLRSQEAALDARISAENERYRTGTSAETERYKAGLTAATAQGAAQRDQYNKDRQYQLDVAKHGVERADSLMKQRQDSAKSMGSRIATMLPPGRDGKPDLEAGARYTEALNAQIGELMQQLREEVAQDPTNRQKATDLKTLEEKGLGALDEEDIRRFVAGMQYNELRASEQSSIPLIGGLMPWSSRNVESSAPVTGLRREERFGFDHYVDDQGGSVPAYKVDRRGSTLGLFGTRNRNFDTLKR